MIRRLLSAASLALLLIAGLPAVASAHVLKIDGHIGAVLHINPDDNPTAGDSTDYVLSFDDDTGKFSLPDCNCSVSIIADSKMITRKRLVVSDADVSENRYTFTKSGVYTMRFTGTPKRPDAFQPFVLNYEVRVTGGDADAQPFPGLLWVGLAMAVGLILLAAYAMENQLAVESERKQ